MQSQYKVQNGNDLSDIFASGSSPSVITGYTLSDGSDISTIFAPGSTPTNSGYKLPNGNDLSTLFREKYSPFDVTGCCLWLDASDSNSVTHSSGSVSNWKDKSVNQYNLTQTTPGNRPVYSAATLNGLPTLAFNPGASTSVSSYLVGDANANAFKIAGDCYAIFAVSKTTNNGYVYAKSKAAAGAGRLLLGRAGGKYYVSYRHNGETGLPNTISDTNNSFRIIELIVNRASGSDVVYVNGTAVPDLTHTYPGGDLGVDNDTSLSFAMMVGAYNSTTGTSAPSVGTYLNGNIAEIVAVKNPYDMTIGTRQWIEGYLAWKWGLNASLPVGHGYRNSAPSSLPPPPT
jgi:hypothetical protein